MKNRQNRGYGNTHRILFPGKKANESFLTFTNYLLGCDVSQLLKLYTKYAEERVKHRGRYETAVTLKRIYNVALRYAADVRFKPLPFMKSDRDGFPKAFKAFKPFLRGTADTRRAALSVLQYYRTFEPEGPYSLESITAPYTGPTEPAWLDKFDETLGELFPITGIEERIQSLRPAMHVSGSQGPNGRALMTSHIDRKAIMGTSIERSIIRMATLTGNQFLNSLIAESNCMANLEVANPKNLKPVHSRLSVKHEAGGKARVFAICDFFSQAALKPLHLFLMKWLKDIPEDASDDHATAATAVKRWTRNKRQVWSFDLTNATDRFPVWLQERVMAAIFGPAIAEEWRTILTDRTFIGPKGEEVRFAAGQPLGALSSWAAFTVTHHVLVRTAAKLCGLKSFRTYRLIGDDNSMTGRKEVPEKYLELMTDLKVDISVDKSIVPEQCISHPAAEIAKRVFANGDEITPVPPDAVIEGMASPMGKRNLIHLAVQRGYTRTENPLCVQSILKNKDFAAITLPIRQTYAPLKGVISIMSGRRYDEPDCNHIGLSPQWLFWENTNYVLEPYQFTWIFNSFIVEEVNSAISRANAIREELFNSYYDGSLDRYTGDWQPRINSLSSGLFPLIISIMSEAYGQALLELRDDPPVGEVQKVLNKLYSVMKPDSIFRLCPLGRDRSLYELGSRLVSTYKDIASKGENSFLDYTNRNYW